MNVKEQFTLSSASGYDVVVSVYGLCDYETVFKAMSAYASEREEGDADQIWLVQHPPVYTQGTACDQETLLPSDIPVVKTDRGGQITYHGPGQIIMYPLLRLKRFGLGVKSFVSHLEQSVIDTLADFDVKADRRDDAPGVYVDQAKIAALGLRIRRGNSYHGLSLNLEMDLTPFLNVDPCGYKGMQVAQLSDLIESKLDFDACSKQLLKNFLALI